MNITTSTPPITSIHSLYCSLTGFQLALDMHREAVWFDYLRRFTADDLRTVVRHLKQQAKQGRAARSLKFRSLIVNLDYFEEDLAEARAVARGTNPYTDRDSVLAATGRIDTNTPLPRSAHQILAAMKAAQEFSRLKETL